MESTIDQPLFKWYQRLKVDIGHITDYNNIDVLAYVISVYDGDTITVQFDHHGEIVQRKVRMDGYDSPEMKPPLSDPNRDTEKQKAHAARAALIQKFAQSAWPNMVLCKLKHNDKYGRILAEVFTIDKNGAPVENLNKFMLVTGHGKEYHGGHKEHI